MAPSTENIKTELGNRFYYIRFPMMHPGEFDDCLEKYPDLLAPAEYFDILQYINKKRPVTIAQKFNTLRSYVKFDICKNPLMQMIDFMKIPFVLLRHGNRKIKVTILMDRSNAILKNPAVEFSILNNSESVVFSKVLPVKETSNVNLLKCVINPIEIKSDSTYFIFIRINRATGAKWRKVPICKPNYHKVRIESDNINIYSFISEIIFESV